MGTISKDLIQYAIDNNDSILGELTIHESYSGRFMYGEECFGISGSMNDLLAFAAAYTSQLILEQLAEQEDDPEGIVDQASYDAVRLFSSASFDNMARDTIVYFPGWTLGGADD